VWFRLLLFGILAYLVIRMISQFFSGGSGKKKEPDIKGGKAKNSRKVSKDIGDYIDYEELDD
jgi:hypothetical protein